jgi:protein gp37
MGDKSAIEWCDASWVSVTGCTKVSDGCLNCYAEALTERLRKMGQPKYAAGFDVVRTHPETLAIPFRWRDPRKVFVNSMSDTFHARVPRAFVDRLFAVMALTPRHTYQVLTKRPLRAARYLADPETPARVRYHAGRLHLLGGRGSEGWGWGPLGWPLPNVWLGTSVEDNRQRGRVRALLTAPAAIRFLSCEPLIGPLDLKGYLHPNFAADDPRHHQPGGRGVDWVIVGGESGPHHRPVDPSWVRDLRDQCEVWGTAYFFKQWGGLTPKSGGRLLDGRTWDEFPAARVTA